MPLTEIKAALQAQLGEVIQSLVIAHGELTLSLDPTSLITVAQQLNELPAFRFTQLTDLTVVDYLSYGEVEWETCQATEHGYDRAVEAMKPKATGQNRFAVIYHLLSIEHNMRIRLKIFLPDDALCLASVTGIWPVANWYEREAFDLFGIMFSNHPDLRRILTDYGFEGHPMRKDFPLSGHVEVRYDAATKKVIYEPVDIEPRTLVPRVKRTDFSQLTDGEES